ncbi:SUMO ligase siz1 [Gryganskiella cystojenkinii]|nr:SUMO ligase siz1 [Gryganskiella cystojenkinii]
MEDYQTITGRIIPSLLVTQLKSLIKNLNETIRPAPQLKVGGNKQDLIFRLTTFITQCHHIGDQVVIRQIRNCVAEFNQGATSTILTSSLNSTPQIFDGYRSPQASSMLASKSGHGSGSGQQQPQQLGNTSSRSYQQPQPSSQPSYLPMRTAQGPNPNLVFKSSPFYKAVQTLSPPRLCLGSYAINVRAIRDPTTTSVTAHENLRGMKNKPGTVSPANITKYCRTAVGEYNKIEFIYANSTKTSVETIVAEIEHGKFLSKEKMLKMIEDRNKDDDIMATSSTLSLKCPLGFQRITLPCRSSYCQHLQCFDAYTYFNLNEQTPTWTCPVCSRTMHSWEEIVVDGYFKDILNSTPKNLESVTVRADGQWEIPSTENEVVKPTPQKKAPSPSDVFVLDDSDDDELPTMIAPEPPAPAKPAKPAVEIIDLISDSEDEAEETPTVDADGDSRMQEAASSLHSMAKSQPVKTEFQDKPAASGGVQTPFPATPAGMQSLNGSPAASSDDSPIISNRMVQTDHVLPATTTATNGVSEGWSGTQEAFMHDLLNPRRKRLYEDTVDEDSRDNVQDARQRISRMDLRSNASSENGTSTVPSPENARTSTSSPTNPEQQSDREGSSTSRSGRDPQYSPAYYDTVLASGTAISHIPFSAQQPPTGLPANIPLPGSRHTTLSPPHLQSYGGSATSPHHHHAQQQRSTNSPNPGDYYNRSSRSTSSASIHATAPILQRSNSIGSRPSNAGSWSAPEPRLNGNGDRWTGSRPSQGSTNVPPSYLEDAGSRNSSISRTTPPNYPGHSTSSSSYYAQRPRSPGGNSHDYGYDRRGGSLSGGSGETSGSRHPQQQHVYNPSTPGDGRSDEEAPIFNQGLRGTGARAR